MEIEKKLKDARIRVNLTQEQVAEKIMVSRQTISNWENGKSLPDIVSVIKLSELYQISLDDLLKGDKKMKEKIEKDATIAKRSRQVLLITGILFFTVAVIYFISILAGGSFYAFCKSALIWVLLGLSIACVGSYESTKK